MFPDNWMIFGDNNIWGSTGAPVQKKKLGAGPAVFELAMYVCLGRPFLSMRGISMSYVNLYDNLWAQLQGSTGAHDAEEVGGLAEPARHTHCSQQENPGTHLSDFKYTC